MDESQERKAALNVARVIGQFRRIIQDETHVWTKEERDDLCELLDIVESQFVPGEEDAQ